jgi:hypothetical protein
VPVSEVPRWLSLRCGYRVAVAAEDFVPTIPDWACDMHTMKGKAMGCGLDHLRSEDAKLVPPPTGDDPYEDEAYRLWALKQQGR